MLPSELAFEFAKNGYDVTALVGYPREYVSEGTCVPQRDNLNGVKIVRLKYTGFKERAYLNTADNYFKVAARINI